MRKPPIILVEEKETRRGAVPTCGADFIGLLNKSRATLVCMAPLPAGRRNQAALKNRVGELDFCRAASHIAAMNALLFDTLKLSRILRDKGHFAAEQPEALCEALGEASHGDLATKADLADLAPPKPS